MNNERNAKNKTMLTPLVRIVSSFVVFLLVLLLIPSAFATERTLAGYFETAPGAMGEKNRLCITPKSPDIYFIEIQTVICPSVFSKDCLNAKMGSIAFSAKPKNGKLSFYEADTKCHIDVAVKNKKALITQSLGKCTAQFPNDDAGGMYIKIKSSPSENDCSP